RISCIWKHEREQRIWGSELVHPNFRPKWKRDDLCSSKQIARPMELFGSGRRDRENASANRPPTELRYGTFALIRNALSSTHWLPRPSRLEFSACATRWENWPSPVAIVLGTRRSTRWRGLPLARRA